MATNSRDHGEWYTADCGKKQYTLPVRYQDIVHIGEGAYSTVIRAKDTQINKYVAIKKILRPFDTPERAKRTYRKLKLLIHLNHPDAQVIQLYDVFTPEKTPNDFQTLYFVLNYVDCDLNRVIRRHVPFTEEHIQYIIYSLLRGLKFFHSADIVHRHLNPGHIGIDKSSNVTILHFGSARNASNVDYDDYVCARWWRAPDLFINLKPCNEKVDVWSVGCIMAELILLQPIFPGRDHIDHLNKIFDLIGTPDVTTLNAISTPAVTAYISRLSPKPRQDFNQLFGFKYSPETQTPISGVSPHGIDLLDRLLSFDPRIRPTAEQALDHPFFESYHDPMEEPTVEPLIDEHQDAVHSIPEWKSIIWQKIQEFIPPSWVNDDDDD